LVLVGRPDVTVVGARPDSGGPEVAPAGAPAPPYRRRYTAEQLHVAYPQARAFFLAKRKYDPEERFQNLFYLTYGR